MGRCCEIDINSLVGANTMAAAKEPIIIWQLLVRSTLKNKDKIPGRLFEFLFLFLASYAVTFIASFAVNPTKIFDSVIMFILFIPSFISAVYCGWLYYVKGFCN
jgi:hypothetical protein